jgi:CD109 antigen
LQSSKQYAYFWIFRYKGVKRVDTEDKDTKVIIYFDTITRQEICPTIEAFRTHRVANQKPAPVLVYDYYDQSRRAMSFYDVVPATVCDICEGDDCPDDGCPDRPQLRYGLLGGLRSVESGARALVSTGLLLLLAVLLH